MAPFSLSEGSSFAPGGSFDPGEFGEFRAHTPILPAGIYTLDLEVFARADASTIPWPPTAWLLVGAILVAVIKAQGTSKRVSPNDYV